MLIAACILSLVLLVLANLVVSFKRHPVDMVLLVAAVVTFLPCLLFHFFPVIFIHACGLFLLAFTCCFSKRRHYFLPLSIVVTVVVYAGQLAFIAWELAYFRNRFPMVSMEERLPVPKAEFRVPGLSPTTQKRLAELETKMEWCEEMRYPDLYLNHRREQLKRLHNHAVETFINQPGFGVFRLPRRITEWHLETWLRDTDPVPQPGEPLTSHWSDDTVQTPVENDKSKTASKDFSALHLKSIIEFVNPEGLGYTKDRRHVAGFQEHQFGIAPASVKPWKLHRLELVGLVVHDDPVAYVSEYLPRMDELRNAPTRPLNPFETQGLEALRKGEDLYIREVESARKMLGAIRSVKQCVGCHGGERGDLLGAFSYTFLKETAVQQSSE